MTTNWTQTREKLLVAGIPADRLPVEWRPGVDLRGANLRWANLRGADLGEADLSGANLRWANLRGVDLREADLSEADLRWANLRGADLGEADLRWANLRGADLGGATINWKSHDLIAEILLRAAGDNMEQRMVAGLILISPDWCWDEFLALDIDPALREWALDTLRGYVRQGDNAPDVLKQPTPGGRQNAG